ncbi:MAG: AIPR family protein [Chloroflexi bacterium]|nr:AIPR family protein [Chloroflexota bacterium]
MPTKKQTQQKKIDRLTSLIKSTGENFFGGNLERGFLFWAAQLHLNQAETSPTINDLLENITDGKDDLEIDEYFIDDDAGILYLFQAKYRSSPGNIPPKDLSNFLDAPIRITNPQALVKNTNEKILQFAPLFREKILDGFELQLVHLSTYNTTIPIQAQAQKWSEEPLVIYVAGEAKEVPHSVIVNDLDNILNQFDSAVDQSTLVLDLPLLGGKWHPAPAGKFDCLIANVEAEKLASIFNQYKYKIFRHNPRGPLGAVKANKEIRETLEDPTKRPWFHLLNNGLSAVCHSFTEPKTEKIGVVTTVQDFQIVNGCQTTYNIWDYWRRGGTLKDVQVIIKLVAGPTLQSFIKKSSNLQSQMKDWDFLFDDPTQMKLQKEFQLLSPPVFYELRRGEYAYMSQSDAQRVAIKDITQATWAFLGSPGQAKDKLRDVPRSIAIKSSLYNEIFFEGVSASYLWLPWLVYQKVQKEYQNHYNDTQIRGDYREHGRLHILWLIGRSLAKALGRKTYKELDMKTAGSLAEQIDEWFPTYHKIAVDAVEKVTEVKQEAASMNNQTLSLRQLFRSSTNYADFEKAHDKFLKEAASLPVLQNVA